MKGMGNCTIDWRGSPGARIDACIGKITRSDRAAVLDISCTGARLSARQLKVDEVRVFGTVVWTDDDECGAAFAAALMPFEVDRLRRKTGVPRLAGLSTRIGSR
jgi:hypothetical protein